MHIKVDRETPMGPQPYTKSKDRVLRMKGKEHTIWLFSTKQCPENIYSTSIIQTEQVVFIHLIFMYIHICL